MASGQLGPGSGCQINRPEAKTNGQGPGRKLILKAQECGWCHVSPGAKQEGAGTESFVLWHPGFQQTDGPQTTGAEGDKRSHADGGEALPWGGKGIWLQERISGQPFPETVLWKVCQAQRQLQRQISRDLPGNLPVGSPALPRKLAAETSSARGPATGPPKTVSGSLVARDTRLRRTELIGSVESPDPKTAIP